MKEDDNTYKQILDPLTPNLLTGNYEDIKGFFLLTIEEEGVVAYLKLKSVAEAAFRNRLGEKVGLYIVTVKLDLEARGIIEIIPKTQPALIRLVKG